MAGSEAGGATTVDIGDDVPYSLMLDSGSSQDLSRTFGTPTTQNTWTYSVWCKRGKLSVAMALLYATGYDEMMILAADTVRGMLSGANTATSTAVLRDPGAHLHLVFSCNAGALTIYRNNESIATGSGTAAYINKSGVVHRIGSSGGEYYDGYISDCIFVDGQALTPSSFGRTSADTGAWVHKTYAGTYGNNGFRLDFSNSADLGNDVSGNNNDWTTNGGISSANQYTDTPTNNHSIWNKLNTATTATLTLGNTKTTASTIAVGSMGMTGSMKSYWEVASAGGTTTVGMWNGSATTTTTIASGKTYGIRFDSGAGTLDYINITDAGAWTAITTGLTATPYFQYVSTAAATTATLNSGSKSFTGSVPTGYSALCTANLPAPAILDPSDHFFAKIRTGTGASYSVTGLNFQPDLVWVKGRSGATDHAIYDAVRGVQKQLESNTTTDETTETTGLTAFNSDGYTGGALAQMNTNTATYIDWMWKESMTAGLDIVSYTGNGANRTINHGLGVVPKMVIIKSRTTAGADTNWAVYHASLANTEYLLLNSTAAKATGATYWNSTTPTSSVFSLGTHADVNTNSDTYIAYCFTEIEGFSKFGSYTGNGSTDGPFVYCGFRPKYILIKNSSAVASWIIFDSVRQTYNVMGPELYAEDPAAEVTNTRLDITSNGFKLRSLGAAVNASNTYIFSAFAELPFKYATAR